MSAIPPPSPFVLRFLHGRGKLRKGRGFSLGELKQAGLQESQARSMGLRIDTRRSNVHPQNVSSLSTFLDSSRKAKPLDATVEDSIVVPGATRSAPSKKKAKSGSKPAKKRKR